MLAATAETELRRPPGILSREEEVEQGQEVVVQVRRLQLLPDEPLHQLQRCRLVDLRELTQPLALAARSLRSLKEPSHAQDPVLDDLRRPGAVSLEQEKRVE